MPLPVPSPTPPTTTTDYLDYLLGLIDTPDVYGPALPLLASVYTAVARSGRVTKDQRRTVRRIVAPPTR